MIWFCLVKLLLIKLESSSLALISFVTSRAKRLVEINLMCTS
ncbi:hypothetical protein LINGRAPRIM_LOCUS389 [Linum grandiflorum]